ncbi:hypothetical protein CVT24_000265 [Panaeolus cyanescens]|uniref:Uncharacterized protein n=1 Tax=Panaeolus cyanescens TaxID=181874 RepID=A0A409YDA0_9AGAR|nr:hypothetical protein CVT24_000265 [Panaeolus cyanescens]
MSFRIAIPRPPRLQRQPLRAPKVIATHSAAAPTGQHAQFQSIASPTTPSQTRSLHVSQLRQRIDLQDLIAYGDLLRSFCAIVLLNDNNYTCSQKMQAAVVVFIMAAFLPFVVLVMLVDAVSAKLHHSQTHPKFYCASLCTGTLILLSIFPATILFTTTLIGFVVILRTELQALPVLIQGQYTIACTMIKRHRIGEKWTNWTEELYDELMCPGPTHPNQQPTSGPDIEQCIGASAIPKRGDLRATNTAPPTFRYPPPSTHCINSNLNSTASSSSSSLSTILTTSPSLNQTLKIHCEPITFPKVLIQPSPSPQQLFDSEGWLLLPSSCGDSSEYRCEFALQTVMAK